MNTITNSGYLPLSSYLSGNGTASGNTGTKATPVQTLVSALAAASGNSGSANTGSYMLDLSPQAQQLLNSYTQSASSDSAGSTSSFTLNRQQQDALQSIMNKFKDSPLTQATFNQIQDALRAAGISPQTLSMMNQVNSFNPTSALLDALNGNDSSLKLPGQDSSDTQDKQDNYMQSIVKLWQQTNTSNSGS